MGVSDIKRHFSWTKAAAALAMMCLLPLSAGPGLIFPEEAEEPAAASAAAEDSCAEPPPGPGQPEAFVWVAPDGARRKIEDRELVIGAVAFEMVPASEPEALKAQAVASYSHFCARRQRGDSAVTDGYYTPEQLRERWGGEYEKNRKIIEQAVDAVFPEVLRVPDGSIADCAYHAISSGMTEDAAEVFGQPNPLLHPVPSPFDALSPGFLSKRRFTPDELKQAVSSFGTPQDLPPDQAVQILRTSTAGSVLTVRVCGVSLTGQQLRRALGLRSAHFTVRSEQGGLLFSVQGYGHGVGMSQAGAQAMARQGASYREILRHYYSQTPSETA